MNNTAQNIPRMTAEEYYEATKRSDKLTELLDGQIVNMASPNVRHQDIASGLISEFRQFVRQNGGKCRPFAAPTDVRLDDLNVVVPDVFITCHPELFDEQFLLGAPDFVAEITSTNRSDDFNRKLWLYRRSGVREYWIIDLKKEKVLVYFFEDEDSPEIYDFHTSIPVHIWDGKICITVAELEML